MASSARTRGNALFAAGSYAEAAAAYSEGLMGSSAACESGGTAGQQEDLTSERALLLGNRAACYVELGRMDDAAQDAHACLTLQPLNAKAHYRLARALGQDDEDAPAAIAAAVALLPPAARTPALLALYGEVQRAAAAAGAAEEAAAAAGTSQPAGPLRLQLPEDPARVVSAATWDAAAQALTWGGARLVVLSPGTYITNGFVPPPGRSPCTLLGLGDVLLKAGARCMHAVMAVAGRGPLTVANARLQSSGGAAAACVSDSDALLRLLNVTVRDDHASVLVVGGEARLDRCTFSRNTTQAVEAREGGAVAACRTIVTGCRQGFSAYGGARSVRLTDCAVERSSSEGVLLAGTFTNAATDSQALLTPHIKEPVQRPLSEEARKVSLRAEALGRQAGTLLEAVLCRCTIAHSGQFGVSADAGTRLVMQQCCLRANDPYCLLVKGGTDASVVACQMYFSGAPSKSAWAKTAATVGLKTRQAGISVEINYHGEVVVAGNAFVGPDDLAVLQLKTDHVNRRVGMFSRPAQQHDNRFFAADAAAVGLPSVEELAQRLPGACLLTEPDSATASKGSGSAKARPPHQQARRRTEVPPLAALQRPCLTYPQAAWAPTAYQYYAIGNTLGYNVAEGAPAAASATVPDAAAAAAAETNAAAAARAGAAERGADAAAAGAADAAGAATLQVLLGACGDIRNLLATVHGAIGCGGGGRRLALVLNDGNVSMLARDAVLLHMAAELQAGAEAVLAVWANHGLTAKQAQLLDQSLGLLADGAWPSWLSAADTLHGEAAEGGAGVGGSSSERLRAVFRAWRTSTLPLSGLLALRDEVLGSVGSELRTRALELSMLALGAVGAGGGRGAGAAERLRREVAWYLREGSLQADGDAPSRANPTLLLAPELQYTLYFSSSILRVLPLGAAADGAPAPKAGDSGRGGCHTVTVGLLATLRPQLASLVHALRSEQVMVRLIAGDILMALTAARGGVGATSAPQQMFDFIDCSNVADYVSLPAMVQAAAPLLSSAPHARLRLESIVEYGAAQQQQGGVSKGDAVTLATLRGFAEGQLGGLSLATFEEAVGLSLCGGGRLVGLESGVRMEWAPLQRGHSVQPSPPGLSSWLTAPHLLLELLAVFKRSLSLAPPPGVASPALGRGRAGSAFQHGLAPATLAHLLALAAPRGGGGAEALLRAALRCCERGGPAALFKWELMTHAQISAAAGGSSPLKMRRMTYDAQPGFALLHHSHNPLLLAVSKDPLPPGGAGPPAVKQLISAFAYDEQAGVAHWLLPESLAEQCGAWHVTLCAVRPSGGLEVAGRSVRIAALPATPAVALPWHGLVHPALSELDLSLVEAAAQRAEQGQEAARNGSSGLGQTGTAWQSTIKRCAMPGGGEVMVVDVLAPGLLPSAESATVQASVVEGGAGRQLRVSVTGKKGGAKAEKGQGSKKAAAKGTGESPGDGGVIAEQQFDLPVEVGLTATLATKVSRRLGLLSVHITL